MWVVLSPASSLVPSAATTPVPRPSSWLEVSALSCVLVSAAACAGLSALNCPSDSARIWSVVKALTRVDSAFIWRALSPSIASVAIAATWVVVSAATWLLVSERISADVKPDTSVVGVTSGGPL